MRRPTVTVRNHRSGEFARFRCIVAARAAFLALTKADPDARCTLEGADGRILRERDPHRKSRSGFVGVLVRRFFYQPSRQYGRAQAWHEAVARYMAAAYD